MQRRTIRFATVRIGATLAAVGALWLVVGSVAVAKLGVLLGGGVALWSGSSLVVVVVFAAEYRACRPQQPRPVPHREERRPVPAVPRTAAV